jgi:putative membrane protein
MTRLRSIASTCIIAAATAFSVSNVAAQEPTPSPQKPPKPAPSSPPSPSSQRPSATVSATASPETKTFVDDMTVAGLAEVQLGQMAAKQAQNADVKAFGQMMVKDHTQANKELSQIASRMKITPPTELDQKHKDLADKLSKLNGAEFDREYMSAMVSGHEEVASKLSSRAGSGKSSTQAGNAGKPPSPTPSESSLPGTVGTSGGAADEQAVDKWAAKTLPVVRKHLDRAKELQAKAK